MELPRKENQHCEVCGNGPNFTQQIGGSCAEQIVISVWDGVPNTCQWFKYVPGADAEVGTDGRLINE